MNYNLKGKVALVTGASRGIGRAIVERLSGDGVAVVINYATQSAPADELVRKIESAGGQAAAIKADVGRVPEVVRLFDETISRFGKIDTTRPAPGRFTWTSTACSPSIIRVSPPRKCVWRRGISGNAEW